MASVELNVQGDATGGVDAVEQTKAALAGLPGAAQAANEGLSAAGGGADKAFTSIERTGSGLRALSSSFASVAPVMAEAGGASAQLGSSLGGLGAGLLTAATTANPLVATLVGVSAAAVAVGPVMDALGIGAAKVAPPMTAAELAAKDATLTFGSMPGSVGVSTDSLIRLAAAGLRVEGPVTEAGSVAQQAASQIFEIIGASDAAAAGTAKLATQSDLLAASQDQMSNRLMASVGSFNAVAAAAAAAGMSVSEYQQIVGTQTAVPAPTELWQGPAARAGGGPVTAGVPYIVGENHPGGRGELFIPNQSGTILPAGSFDRAAAAGQGAPWASTQVIFAPQFHMNAPAYGYDDLRRTVLGWVQDSIDQFNSFHGHIEGN